MQCFIAKSSLDQNLKKMREGSGGEGANLPI